MIEHDRPTQKQLRALIFQQQERDYLPLMRSPGVMPGTSPRAGIHAEGPYRFRSPMARRRSSSGS
jgi:hypothetical protein